MEQHDILYKPIKTNDIVILARDENPKKKSSKPFIRQIIVCSSVWVSFFLGGLCFGAPTVVIPQLRKEAGSDDAVSQEMASWISSVYGFASVPWIIIIPLLSGRIGRKYPFLAVSIVCFTSSIYFYCSNSAEQILIAQILQSAIYGCTITISIAIVAEYASPNYRGMFLCFQPATGYWGIWIANALGTWFHWSTIPILGIICSLYNIVTTLLWCESPAWLASAGKYEECAKAHRWLRGENAESEKELASLIGSCKQNLDKHDREKKRKRNVLKELCNTITRKQFYMPLLLAIAVLLLYQTSGKLVCSMYAIDVIQNITGSEATAYKGMLLLDGVTIISTYIACILTKTIKRRKMLLTGSTGGTVFLFVLALYLYLTELGIVQENQYIPLALLSLFSLVLSFGPMILCTSLYGELIPLQYRTAGMFISGIFVQIVESVTLLTALQMFEVFGMHGTFLFYGITSGCMTLFLYKYLPETKDKTLQEIEEYFIDERVNPSECQPMAEYGMDLTK